MTLPTHFTLNDGRKMPAVHLGTWQSPKGEVRDAVETALKNGYRAVDGAWGYGNEDEVGEGIKASGVAREDIWITTKLFEFHHSHVRQACLDSMKKLGVEYLDLYLMHWPMAWVPGEFDANGLPSAPKKTADGKSVVDQDLSQHPIKVWREMEKLVDEGLVKSIGLSNFNIRRTRELLKEARIKPVVNQVELSFACPQPELVDWLKRHDIVPQAYSPLGSTGASQTSAGIIEKLAKKYDVQGANILISWAVARGTNPLPKSVTPARIINNIKTVELTKEEVDEIEKAALSHPPHKVCDQTDSQTDFDVYEANHPENNDKAQAKLD